MNSLSTEILEGRLRNRIMEHLSLLASAEAQLAYQVRAPAVHVTHELFNAWDAWVPNVAALNEFTSQAFSPEEQAAVREFSTVLEAVSGNTPNVLPQIKDFIGTPAWQELSSAASNALAVFRVRGMGPEHGGAISQETPPK